VKKRKLNSTNPKYYPVEEVQKKERKELLASGRVKVYAIFTENK
jgi:hypothetical protein